MKQYEFPKKVVDLEPYEPITGDFKVRLDANESFLAPNGALMETIGETVAAIPWNRYPDPYCKNLCKTFAKTYEIADPDFVVAGNGSDELISVIISGMFNKGDKILSLTPDFSMYSFYPNICEAVAMTMKKEEEDLTINVDKVIDCINQNDIAALLFSNPCNPTSLGLCRSEVIRLIDSVEALVIVDEAYMEFFGDSVMDLAGKKENLIVLKTCSKAIGMAGIRLGFAVSTKRIIDVIKAVKSPYNVNCITQAVGEEVLSSRDYIRSCVREILRSRQGLQEQLDALAEKSEEILKVYKSDCNFIFVKMKDSQAVFEALMRQGIVVRCLGEYLRITAGNREENDALMDALSQLV